MFSTAESSICGFTAMKTMSECSTTNPVHRSKRNVKDCTGTKIKSISVQKQLNSMYYIELHVLTYLRSSSGSQLLFKHIEVLYSCNPYKPFLFDVWAPRAFHVSRFLFEGADMYSCDGFSIPAN
jgi:hypothetical protein